MRRQIKHLHVIDHPLSNNSHETLLCDMKALQAASPECRDRTSSGMQEDQFMTRVTTAKRLVQSAVCSAPHTAEFERELIRAAPATASSGRRPGVHMGRPPKLTKHQ